MAGGKSRRMGRDKAWLDLGDGRPIVQRVSEVLNAVADEVIVVANDERFATLGHRVVPDRFPEGGVLGGIATGVASATGDLVLVAACDMPTLVPQVFRLLIDLAEGYDVVVPLIRGEYEGLHAAYRKTCVPAMERALAGGKMRVISFFDDVRVRIVSEDEVRAVDPTLSTFTNVNTPQELAALLRT